MMLKSLASRCVGVLALAAMLLAARRGLAQGNSGASDAAIAGVRYDVRGYEIEGKLSLSPDLLTSVLAKHTGTNISLEEIIKAAADVQLAYGEHGYPGVSVAIGPQRIKNGTAKLLVFQGATAQILVAGKRCMASGREAEANPTALNGSPSPSAKATADKQPSPPVGEREKNGQSESSSKATNNVPHFPVRAYDISGNSLLSKAALAKIFVKHTGTNVTLDDIVGAAKELQMEYHDRGYDTVNVTLPPQSITNGAVKIKVFEGRLAEIRVANNHYYSSNNVMAALPGLRTNMILNSRLFQPELDRANANQDRQVYPRISPGPDPDTTDLLLDVKDRFPLHAKIELNNQSSPGTPDLRLNASAVYNNLWQADNSLGAQYSFSPEAYKAGDQWEAYDKPLVANYSAFYRMPLGNPPSMEDEVASRPGTFGYDEATRKFNLPPPSGVPELNIYASRSTIDTGNIFSPLDDQFSTNGFTVSTQSAQESVTVNEGLGFRLTEPMPEFEGIASTFSTGLDYKNYSLVTTKTSFDIFVNSSSTNTFTNAASVTAQSVQYLPLSFRWDAHRADGPNSTDFSFGYTVNFSDIFFNTRTNFQNVAGSTNANGYYQILTASLGRDQVLYKEWRLSLRADGQWANQPLISNEQFGVGGINGVRGYREGEVFGDTGWRIISELKTPPHVIGEFGGVLSGRLTVRASIFMDYAETYLLDPNGRSGETSLWGTGIAGAASIGHNWEARLMFGLPLLKTPTSEADQFLVDFSLSAQF